MTASQILGFVLIMISPAIGSFVAVLADRLPRGENWITAPSRCRTCNTQLQARDLVPVVSFALSGGRCRTCAAPIPPVALYAELLALGAAVLAVLAGGGVAVVITSALWLWLMLALALSDAAWMRLPDGLTLGAFVLALGIATLPGGIGFMPALWGAAMGCGSFALLRWGYAWVRGHAGLGLGDVKLMAGLGAFAGPLMLPHLVATAAVGALCVAVLTRKGAADGLSKTRALPFGTALCVAAALIWFWRALG